MSGGPPNLSYLNALSGLSPQSVGQQSAQQIMQMALAHQQYLAALNARALPPIPITVSARRMPRWLKPDPRQPDTLGWRAWLWHEGHECLMSPHQQTIWPTVEFKAPQWSEADAVRGIAGIHARLVPKHWRLFGWPDDEASSGIDENAALVTGIVERFGRYVLGTEGWRAEQVIIREVMAPSTKIGLLLEQRYPDLIVHYPEEGDDVCKSVKSSALEKGNRSLLPSLPPMLTRPSSPEPSPSSPSENEKTSLLKRLLGL